MSARRVAACAARRCVRLQGERDIVIWHPWHVDCIVRLFNLSVMQLEIWMHLNLKFLCLGLGAAAVLIGTGGAAMAQQYRPQHPMTGMMAPHAAQVSPQTVAKFKRAYWSVKAIQQKYAAKIRAKKMQPMGKAASKLRRWAQTSMVNAVKRAGLTVGQFDHMMGLMQREPALRKQVLSH